MTLAQFKALGINTNHLYRTTSLDDARRFALSCGRMVRLIVQGCDGRYWVVSAKDAGTLRKAGYETV